MHSVFLSIIWNPNMECFRLMGLPIRYYSLLWCIGLISAYLLVKRFYKDQKIDKEKFEPLFIYCFIGILVGARLGHCLFYQPEYFFASFHNFIEMLLPIEFTPSGIELTGYRGLASHGGTLGIMLSIWLYCKKFRLPLLQVTDMICVATPLTAACIRLGNLMNSEIIGKATGSDYGFIFSCLGESFPRHPAQLYEAIAYLIFFLIGFLIYKKHKELVGSGFYLGFCLTTIFSFRFFVEFFKEVQVLWENGMPIDMGQILSIPFIVIGFYFLRRGLRQRVQKK